MEEGSLKRCILACLAWPFAAIFSTALVGSALKVLNERA